MRMCVHPGDANCVEIVGTRFNTASAVDRAIRNLETMKREVWPEAPQLHIEVIEDEREDETHA